MNEIRGINYERSRPIDDDGRQLGVLAHDDEGNPVLLLEGHVVLSSSGDTTILCWG